MRTKRTEAAGPSPLGAIALGVGAGLVGTTFMTAWQELAARLRRHTTPKHMAGDDPWASAPAPAQIGRRFVQAILQRDVPAERIPLFTNAVHWAYGASLGAAYGVVRASLGGRPLVTGPAFGTGAWAASYAMLVPMGLYEPPWRYKPVTIAKDMSYHVVYGVGAAVGYEALAGIARRRD